MKIKVSDETIVVDGMLRNKFRADAAEITDVRLMADKAVPRGFWGRLRLALGQIQPAVRLRAVTVRAGDRAITLDVYHDEQFESAISWLVRHGWDMESGTETAIKTPFVRVSVERRP